jgi:hypothetical protein
MDSSPSTPLSKAPLEVLQHICHFLSRRDLLSLALVSRVWRKATASRRLSRIRLHIQNHQQLVRDLEEWDKILSRYDGFGYVRRITLNGGMHYLDKAWDLNAPVEHAPEDSDDENDDLIEFTDFHPHLPEPRSEYKQAEHEAWLPLAGFLPRLPSLTDLVYTCANQVPACVLTAIHEHHPHLRLHVSTFSLRSLFLPRKHKPVEIDPDEYALVTSSCLYSIRTHHASGNGKFSPNFNHEALGQMFGAGWFPGLKHLCMQCPSITNANDQAIALEAPRIPWGRTFCSYRGNPPDEPQEPPTSSALTQLDTFSVTHQIYDQFLLQRFIAAWSSRIDFAALRNLTIRNRITKRLLDTFIQCAQDSETRWFRSLRSLNLGVNPAEWSANPFSEFDGKVATLLSVLPPLEELILDGYAGLEVSRLAIFHHHGATLRKLHLPADREKNLLSRSGEEYVLNPRQVLEIARRCPRLRDFRILLRRNFVNETEALRAIAHIPQLQRVHIVWDCKGEDGQELLDHLRVERPWTGRELRDIRDLLMRNAVDETLALAIWEAISEERTHQTLPPLERVFIDTKFATSSEDYSVRTPLELWIRWIGRSWVCQRTSRWDDKNGDEVSVLGKSVAGYEGLKDRLQKIGYWNIPNGKIGGELDDPGKPGRRDAKRRNIWNRTWASRGGDWRDEWHSFPLRIQGDIWEENQMEDFLESDGAAYSHEDEDMED